MPNKRYITGRAYEYKAKHLLEEQGYTVIRAAGSHGPWDLIAMKSNELVRCIQIKRTKTLLGVKQLRAKFKAQQDDVCTIPTYQHELWIWLDRAGWQFEAT